jgi:hypothetical protein
MRWVGHVARTGEMRITYKIVIRKLEIKRLFGRPKRRCKIILEWILGWEGVDWVHLAQDRDQWRTVVKTGMKLWVL